MLNETKHTLYKSLCRNISSMTLTALGRLGCEFRHPNRVRAQIIPTTIVDFLCYMYSGRRGDFTQQQTIFRGCVNFTHSVVLRRGKERKELIAQVKLETIDSFSSLIQI